MVLAAVALDENAAGLLAEQGVRDSKAFGSSDAARRTRAILKQSVEELATWVGLEVCSVQAIDEYVSHGALNLLERERAVRLIERAPTSGRVIADGRNLFSPLVARYPHLEAHDRGESVHVAVAAASICAKVHRDSLFDEIAQRYEAGFGPLRGGGYVNRLTRAFVAEYVHRHGHLPPEARASWPWPGSPPGHSHGNPERVPIPSRALAPAGKARLRLRDHGNPERVPMPSRALAPAGKARLRLRDHGNPERVPMPSRDGSPPAEPAGSPRE
jgi:ribonuclease HII